MMVKTASEDLVFDEYRRRFKTVSAFELPDDGAIVFVEAIDVAVRRRKVNAIVFDRRLTRPGGATPRIFVQTSADRSRFDFPDDFQVAVFPWSGAKEIAFAISQPHRNRGGCLRLFNARLSLSFRRSFSSTADETGNCEQT